VDNPTVTTSPARLRILDVENSSDGLNCRRFDISLISSTRSPEPYCSVDLRIEKERYRSKVDAPREYRLTSDVVVASTVGLTICFAVGVTLGASVAGLDSWRRGNPRQLISAPASTIAKIND